MIGDAPAERTIDPAWVSAVCRGIGWTTAAASYAAIALGMPWALAGALAARATPLGVALALSNTRSIPERETMGA